METCFAPQYISKVYKSILNLSNDYRLYRENVLKGNLYESIQKQYDDQLNVNMTRSDVKTSLFTAFFSSNKFLGQKDARHKKNFSEAFPSIYTLFKTIKADHRHFKPTDFATKPHQLLSIMLQRIESFIVIDLVVKELLENHPNIPVYTIHDSICSTKEHIPFIENLFKTMIEKYTGLTPTFDLQPW